MRTLLCLALIAALSASVAEAKRRPAMEACPRGNEPVVYRQTGLASWYAPHALKRRTASGERTRKSALSAAHRTLPLGSVVHVVNLENCRTVTVTVNDRGPFERRHRGRILDLSKTAWLALGMRGSGLAHVRLEKYASDAP